MTHNCSNNQGVPTQHNTNIATTLTTSLFKLAAHTDQNCKQKTIFAAKCNYQVHHIPHKITLKISKSPPKHTTEQHNKRMEEPTNTSTVQP
jgi:hypothetical protein